MQICNVGVEWKRNPPLQRQVRFANILREHSGPTADARARVKTIRDSFDYIFTDEIINTIVENTNIHALQCAVQNIEEGHELPNFTETSAPEIRAFLGLLILWGVFQGHREASHAAWDGDIATKRPIFSATMSRNRFQELSHYLRFDNKATRYERSLLRRDAAISEIATMLQSRFSQMYVPGESVTVDEQLVRFFGRCKFKVFMPSKPDKYGVKIWVLAEASTGTV